MTLHKSTLSEPFPLLLLLFSVPTYSLSVCPPCPPGEYIVRDCATAPPLLPMPPMAVCWPCEPGFACANGTSKRPCRVGEEWSGAGMAECTPCSGACDTGRMLVRKCDDGVSDRVCADCPDGFGCGDGPIRLCWPGTFSSNGVCVACAQNYTTRKAGATSEAECECLTEMDEEGGCGGGCKEEEGQIAVNGECRTCPPGFGCDRESGRLTQCAADTYSSPVGVCVACGPNSHSAAGAGSEGECVCERGYVRNDDRRCVPCEQGTVFSSKESDSSASCVPCPAGEYCLGRLHHEPCPEDMFSHQGSVVCNACRMNSGCVRHRGSDTQRCTNQANCTCDDGFVDHGGECRRCPAATMKPVSRRRDEQSMPPAPLAEEGCIPCPRGMECMGGPEVRSCDLATFSVGNRSRCSQCAGCREITVARCNATHDSVCEATPYALAVLTLTQYYKTIVDGETFAMFAMVLASSLPKAQLVKVCGGGEPRCVHCFQGQCPVARLKRVIVTPPPGGAFEIVVEIRSNAARLSANVESLTQSSFLSEQAKTTMSKLTDLPFALRSIVDHAVICPDAAEWNGGECMPPTTNNDARTWLGLGVSAALLVLIGVYRGRRRSELNQKVAWARVEEVTGSE